MTDAAASRPRANGRNTLRVLTYHRVANPEDTPTLNPRLISAASVVDEPRVVNVRFDGIIVPISSPLRRIVKVETTSR